MHDQVAMLKSKAVSLFNFYRLGQVLMMTLLENVQGTIVLVHNVCVYYTYVWSGLSLEGSSANTVAYVFLVIHSLLIMMRL